MSYRHIPVTSRRPTANPKATDGKAARQIQPQAPVQFPELQEDEGFKQDLIKDILNQIDYRVAWNRGVVDLAEHEITEELKQLSTRTLIACFEAFIHARSEQMVASNEPNGFKILDRPAAAIRKLMESDPDFDIHQYIF